MSSNQMFFCAIVQRMRCAWRELSAFCSLSAVSDVKYSSRMVGTEDWSEISCDEEKNEETDVASAAALCLCLLFFLLCAGLHVEVVLEEAAGIRGGEWRGTPAIEHSNLTDGRCYR